MAKMPPCYLYYDINTYADLETIKLALEHGIPLSRKVLYREYNLPEPESPEDSFISGKIHPKTSSPVGLGFADALTLELADEEKKTQETYEEVPPHLIQELIKGKELDAIADTYFEIILSIIEKHLFNFETPEELARWYKRYTEKPKKADSVTKEIARYLHEVLLTAFALGIDHLAKDIEITFTDPLKAEIVPEPVPFEEAERYLLSQIPVTKEEWEKLDKNFRLHAFTVARLTELDAIERAKQYLAKAKQEGKTFRQFWETAGKDELLRKTGFHKSNPWYWETVFRNNIQRAYNAGRAYQIQKSETVEYLEFVGIRDARQSPICRARSGIIRPKDDPFWSSNWPPLHHGCRSTVRPVTKYEMKWHGLTPTKELPPMPAPQEGFGDFPHLQAGFVFRMPEKMWERAKQYGIDEEIRKTYQKLYPSIKLPGDKGVKNILWHEKIKHLDFTKDKHVAEFIDFLAEAKPEWFPYGVRTVLETEGKKAT